MLKFEQNGWKWFSGGGGGDATLLVGDGVKKLSVELDSYVIIYLKEFFKLSQVLLTSIAFCSFDAENVKLLWFVPFSLH